MGKETVSLVFTGDIGFDRFMDRKWEDENLLSQCALDFFHSADHTIANVEGALINAKDDGSRGRLFHSMNPEAISFLKKIGADIWSVGNNHAKDAGVAGIISTRQYAQANGCQAMGVGIDLQEASQPVYLEEVGGIGIFCVTYHKDNYPATDTQPGVFAWDEMELIEKRIREIKKKCRWCIVVAHAGEEFAPLPNPYTRELYLKYLELGADVVVGHHPHVPENYELFDNKGIFYSLGNFIFDTNYQRAHSYTELGVLLKLKLTKDKLDFEALGTKIIRGEERIDVAPLPAVFTNIPAEEYELLAPLSAAAFVAEERKKMIFLQPERFTDAPEEVWNGYFFSSEPESFRHNNHMDFFTLIPLAQKAQEGQWKKSSLEEVKAYILGISDLICTTIEVPDMVK